MSKKEIIESFKNLLKQEMNELIHLSTNTKSDRDPVELDQQSIGRLSRMDAIQQQNMSLATEAKRKKRISQIDNALKRIETENFGFCISCGESISDKRLLIDPTVLRCIDCSV